MASKLSIVIATQDSGSLNDIILLILRILPKLLPSATHLVIWLLKCKFASNKLTVREVIDKKAHGLTIPAIERLLRKVLRQVHLKFLHVFQKLVYRILLRCKLLDPNLLVRILHLCLQFRIFLLR